MHINSFIYLINKNIFINYSYLFGEKCDLLELNKDIQFVFHEPLGWGSSVRIRGFEMYFCPKYLSNFLYIKSS